MVNFNSCKMRSLFFAGCVLLSVAASAQQSCATKEELDNMPGKHIDVAHCEWPAMRAGWLNDLKNPTFKATANKVLTQIETIEKDSRKNFSLTGGVLKSSFSTTYSTYRACSYGSIYDYANYDFQLACYEYTCINKKVLLNSEYNTVLRVRVNPEFERWRGSPDGATGGFFEGDCIYPIVHITGKSCAEAPRLLEYVTVPDDVFEVLSKGSGYEQDVPDNTIKKEPNYSIYITRTWYITKPGKNPLQKVTRKEFLQSLLEYYDKEKLAAACQKASVDKEFASKPKNDDWEKRYNYKLGVYKDYEKTCADKKAIVQKVLNEHDADWLAEQVILNNDSWVGSGGAGFLGAYTFKSFAAKGQKLYKYDPDYFRADMKTPAKPQLIRIAFRYVHSPFGLRLIGNFTDQFDRAAWQKLVN